MKHLVLILLAGLPLAAQFSSTASAIKKVTSDPTGNACSAGQYRDYNGALYSCQSGVFAVVTGSPGPSIITFAGTPPGTCTVGTLGVDTTYWRVFACPVTNSWVQVLKTFSGSGAPAAGSCNEVQEAGTIYVDTAATSLVTSIYVCAADGPGPTYAWQNLSAGDPNTVTAAGTLTSNAPMIGAGSKAAAVGSRSGNTTEFATVTGTKTASKQLVFDANGNVTASAYDAGAAGGAAGNPFACTVNTGTDTLTCTNSAAVVLEQGDVITTIAASGTRSATNPSGTDTVFVYWHDGVFYFSSATATASLTDFTAATNASVPSGAIPIASVSVSSSNFLATVTDLWRGNYTGPELIQGANCTVTPTNSGRTRTITCSGGGGTTVAAAAPYLTIGASDYWTAPIFGPVTKPSTLTWTARNSGDGGATATIVTTGGIHGFDVTSGDTDNYGYSTPFSANTTITGIQSCAAVGCMVGVFDPSNGNGYVLSRTITALYVQSYTSWSYNANHVAPTTFEHSDARFFRFTSSGGSGAFSGTSTCAVLISSDGVKWTQLDSRTCPHSSYSVFGYMVTGEAAARSTSVLYHLGMQ